MEIHDFKKTRINFCVLCQTSTEDTTFQTKLAGCAPQLLTMLSFLGERGLYLPRSISIQWDRETGQGQGTPGRGGQDQKMGRPGTLPALHIL